MKNCVSAGRTPVVLSRYKDHSEKLYERLKCCADYVDNHIPMFDNIHMKRLKAYKQIGYELAGSLKADKQVLNAIYDGDYI